LLGGEVVLVPAGCDVAGTVDATVVVEAGATGAAGALVEVGDEVSVGTGVVVVLVVPGPGGVVTVPGGSGTVPALVVDVGPSVVEVEVVGTELLVPMVDVVVGGTGTVVEVVVVVVDVVDVPGGNVVEEVLVVPVVLVDSSVVSVVVGSDEVEVTGPELAGSAPAAGGASMEKPSAESRPAVPRASMTTGGTALAGIRLGVGIVTRVFWSVVSSVPRLAEPWLRAGTANGPVSLHRTTGMVPAQCRPKAARSSHERRRGFR
jgi:hypothetical protein